MMTTPNPSTPTDLAAFGMFMPAQTMGSVLCCICGVRMEPNPTNMCARCLRSRVDITEGLPRHAALVYWPECRSWLQPPHSWIRAELESPKLLALCLRRLKSVLSRLVHAEFIWTLPHSKGIKAKLRIQREAVHDAILEQPHVVEFTQQDRLSDPCARMQASPDQWIAAVQLHQHVPHRRTFLFLEQLILWHGAAARALRIKDSTAGLDFFFSSRSSWLTSFRPSPLSCPPPIINLYPMTQSPMFTTTSTQSPSKYVRFAVRLSGKVQ